MICKTCGKEFFGEWRKDPKSRKTPLLYCSMSCSKSRDITEEHRLRLRKSLLDYYRDHPVEKNPSLHKRVSTFKRSSNPTSILDLSKRTAVKIIKRMGLGCSRCGWHVEGVANDIHHILPKKNGGSDDHHNLTILCPNCHRLAHSGKIPAEEFITLVDQVGDTWKEFYFVK